MGPTLSGSVQRRPQVAPMSQPGQQKPIAFTHDGQPIFTALPAAPGQVQPVGVLSDGQPVWPVGPDVVPPGQPKPLGVLSSGRLVWGAAPRPFYKKKRVLVPAAIFGLLVVAGTAGEQPSNTGQVASGFSAPQAASASDRAADTSAAAEKAAAEKAAKERSAAAAAAQREAASKAAAERAARENPDTLTEREFAKLAKDPDSYEGKYLVVYGEVTQFDSATGDDNFRANSGAQKDDLEFGFTNYYYDTNALYNGDGGLLTDVVEGDVFKATVEVLGSYSYDTQIGGNTTVPQFRVVKIDVYDSTK